MPRPLLLPPVEVLLGRLPPPPAGVDPRLHQLVLDDDVINQRFANLWKGDRFRINHGEL